MNQLELISGGRELLEDVRNLWEKLNTYHRNHSTHFSNKFDCLTFEKRKQKFLNTDLEVHIDLIEDKESCAYIGYCIGTLNKELDGEIDSLFIESKYRQYGLGAELMNRSLEWFENRHARSIIIGVCAGNESALNFYQKFGFFKRSYILERK